MAHIPTVRQSLDVLRARGLFVLACGVFVAIGLAADEVAEDATEIFVAREGQERARIREHADETREQAKSQGYVETVFGRRLYLPEINSPNGPRRAGAERAAINAPMQGTAASR